MKLKSIIVIDLYYDLPRLAERFQQHPDSWLLPLAAAVVGDINQTPCSPGIRRKPLGGPTEVR